MYIFVVECLSLPPHSPFKLEVNQLGQCYAVLYADVLGLG